MPEPTNANNNPQPNNNGGGDGNQNQNQNQNNGGGNGGGSGDAGSLTADQITALLNDPKVLENSNLWNHPRIKELRDGAAEAKRLKDAQAAADTKKLEDDKKWEELAGKHKTDLEAANGTITQLRQDQALTNVLVKAGVVDLDAALKLVDRSKLTADEATGGITGADQAIEALKTERSYLFTQGGGQPNLGSPTNNGQGGNNNPGNTQFKFKRSQLQDQKFYSEHRDEILAAHKAGLIEDDLR